MTIAIEVKLEYRVEPGQTLLVGDYVYKVEGDTLKSRYRAASRNDYYEVTYAGKPVSGAGQIEEYLREVIADGAVVLGGKEEKG